MVSGPEKMFFRHKQVDGNFYEGFLFFVGFSTKKKHSRAGEFGDTGK